jgi:hypothetical protein
VGDQRAPAAAAAAVALHEHSSHSDEQPLLESADADEPAFSPFAQPALQQQLESQLSNAAPAPAGGAWELGPFAGSSGSHARSLVSLWLMRGRTMPADLLARAVDQFHAAQQQEQGEVERLADGPGGPAAGRRSNSPEPPDPPLKR